MPEICEKCGKEHKTQAELEEVSQVWQDGNKIKGKKKYESYKDPE